MKGSEKILIVDDDETTVRLYTETLQPLGYYITGMTGGCAAWDSVKCHPDRYDRVISDMQMPGISGYQWALKILDIRPGMPIIICTGSHEPGVEKFAKAVGIKEYLAKPVNLDILVKKIREYLD